MGELTRLYFSPFKVKLLSFLIIVMGLCMVYLFYLLDNYQAEIADLQERVSVCESTQGQELNKDQRFIFTFHNHNSEPARFR
ncbi:hypothetical protein Desti_2044 [Desulfomonile tiedjei DSM 6799]|uniref:Uncharacterized protein n=1 Tax=Desulfomonile tiedjei (strain ATCC 49306 / DSM 6799 / DCB-1) TaxID=706587 RepID=I4C5A6_DESTA|nr:hypothetical protein Desti_2044 [Desulfomonile tiedjei DSM 6799]